MKTERIEACIEYVRHMETCGIGQRDPNKCGATDARAELAALKEENERLRRFCGEAAEYIDMNVNASAIMRGDGELVGPPFLPALRASGAVLSQGKGKA